MLFHMTISHRAQDCPGRRPTEPPALVAPSDTREALAVELGVKLHFVLWGASCMLWAQPEHLAFAVLETEDLESAMQYVSALVPADWTCTALPVWNLPSQLRLVRQVRMAPPTQFGDAFVAAETAPKAPPAKAEVTPRRRLPHAEPKSDEPPIEIGERVERASIAADSPRAPETNSPGTITLLLQELDAESSAPNESAAESASVGRGAEREQAPPPPTQIIRGAYEPPVAAGIRLVASAGPAKGKTFKVPPEGATIGRLPELQVYLPDDRLSREHARIEFHDGRYWLLDLGSLNGTALNGTLVADMQPLQSGDTIELGSSKLVVTSEPTGRS